MQKLKRPLSLILISIILVLLVVFLLLSYLLYSGVRVKYDAGQKRFTFDVSKNEFTKNLLLKYSKDLVFVDEKTSEDTPLVEDKPNPFRQINDEIARSKESLYKVEPSSENVEAMGMLLRAEVPDAETNWNYQTDVFTSVVKEIDLETSKLLLSFNSPGTLPFLGQERWVDVSCSPTETFVEKDGSYLNANFSLLKNAKVGNEFSSLCKNDTCTEVGGLCRLYQ